MVPCPPKSSASVSTDCVWRCMRRSISLHFVRDVTLFGPPLQGRQPVAVHGRVGIDAVAIERLPDQQHTLPMAIGSAGFGLSAQERDVRGERDVARHLLPDGVEVVGAIPHVLAATRDAIDLAAGIEHCGPGADR